MLAAAAPRGGVAAARRPAEGAPRGLVPPGSLGGAAPRSVAALVVWAGHRARASRGPTRRKANDEVLPVAAARHAFAW
eukprot:9835012-Alexandrium_andersonii.AAC.2